MLDTSFFKQNNYGFAEYTQSNFKISVYVEKL